MQDHVEQVLLDRSQIAARVAEMAAQIADDLHADVVASGGDEDQITIVPILTGSLIFLADLIRELPLMMRIQVLTASSYPGRATASQHPPQITASLPEDLRGHHLLVVDDILDSGNTIRAVRAELEQRNPASLRTCMFLRKTIPSAMQTHADYIGFDIPDEFVVGYGLDFDGYYRNLPDLVVLKPEVTK